MNKIVDIIKHAHSKKNDMIKVKIQQRSVYHKFAEIEIEIPKDWNNREGKEDYYQGYLNDYLHDNEHLFTDKLDKAISEANFEYGSGIYEYNGMDEDVDSEWRFECDELTEGGHL
tara:strand:- start:1309 stop:1653 length:345 start_codon:yes stop_codon:yes gene_type:complete